ncbi:hypothetical protein ABPG74_002302 [Tetrahymena malaccensis]
MNILHGNQPITHLCVDRNCKQSIENVSSQNGKKSAGKMMSSNSILLCCKCIQSSHQNHQVISIEQFIKQAKSESKSNIYDINKQSPNYNVYEQKKNNILQCLQKISQKISNYTQLIKMKELSESSDKALNQRLITQNLQQQEFIMQRIFTLEGNNYSNQAEFEILLKEVQEGLSKNQSVLKQYEVTKKEEDIQLKELDLIFAKLNQETQKIIQLFDRDISYHTHQKLNEFIQQTTKSASLNNDKQSAENLNQEKNCKTLDLNAFDQISKLFSSGAKSGKNQQEQQNEQENSTQQQNITKQRLVEIQNLNPAINSNSTPTAQKPTFNQNNSGGFSNLKLGNFSTAQTNSYVYSDQKLKNDNLNNNKSAANSAIKGYSILSAVKCQTPQSIANENDSAQINSYKKKEAPPAFTSVFPQMSSSKKISPQEKRVFSSANNQPSNIFFVTNSQITTTNKSDVLENQKSKLSLIMQTDNLNFENFTPKTSENSSKIKNIGGNLSPISKPQNAEDELHLTAKEIIQENNIEWLENEDYNLIDRGQFLAKERRQIGQENLNLENMDQQDDEDEDDNITLYDNEDYDSNDFLEKDEEGLIQFGDEIFEQDKENNNQQSFYRQNYNKSSQNLTVNGFQSSAQKNLQIIQNGAQSHIQQNYGQEIDRKKEKRLRKRLSKKLKKLRQQHDLIEQEQMQLKLKQVEEEKKQSMLKLNEVNLDQTSSKQFQYSSCNPANKKNQLKGGNVQIQNSAEKGKQQQLSDKKVNKESNFQNLLSQMKSNQQQNLNMLNSNINQPNLLKESLGYNQKAGIYSSKNFNTAVSPNKQEIVQQFERDQSPDLQHFSNGATISQTKKKLKTNQDQIYEGAPYTNLELRPQQYNFTQREVIKNNNFGINQMKNNMQNQFEYELKSLNMNKFEGSQESQSFQQSMSAFQSQNSTLSNKKDLSLINSQIKGGINNTQNSLQQSQVYNNFNTQRHFNNTQYQSNQYQNPNLQQNNNYNILLNDSNINNNNQQRYGRYAERFQTEFSQSQLKIQNHFSSSQDPFQVPQKPNQQPVIARHNSMIRPYSQNYQSTFNQKQNSLDTSTPFEEQINTNSSKQPTNFRNANTYSKNVNYSNPHNFMQNDERILNKNKNQQSQQQQQQDCVSSIKLQNEISQGLEQIQQQIEFSNSLREQLERKIREEQQNSDKYQQSSSTKRLKFQIVDSDPQNNRHYNYLKPSENQVYNPIDRSFQIDNISSLDDQNQSQYDDQSPLYSPIVQFSPMESDEIA